jgi:endonuclease G
MPKSPKTPKASTVDDAIAALDTVRRSWLRRPGVTAVDVGFKISGDELTDKVALRVHVERKRPVAALASEDVFNDPAEGTSEVDGFDVDVVEAAYSPSGVVLDLEDLDTAEAVDRKTELDPLIGGISCGNPRITAGTIGAIVFDRSTCKPMILSNWHVLAGASAAAPGEEILQPGKFDGGTDVVATLTRMQLDGAMDAAVATLDGSRSHTRDILGLGTITGIEDATLGMQVVKSGRTTAITEGVVDGVSMSVSINYGDPGVVAFNDQVRIVPRPPWPSIDYEVSKGGDSGSVWMNQASNKAIGLHFAGETTPAPTAENAICSPMQRIAEAMDFSFLPVICAPTKPPVFDICDRFPWLCRGWIPRFWGGWSPVRAQGAEPAAFGLDAGGRRGGRPSGGCDCGCDCGGAVGPTREELAEFLAYLESLHR